MLKEANVDGEKYAAYLHERLLNLKVAVDDRMAEAWFGLFLGFRSGKFSQDQIDSIIVEVLAMVLRHEQEGSVLNAMDLATFISQTLRKPTFSAAIATMNKPSYIFVSNKDVVIILYDVLVHGGDFRVCLDDVAAAYDTLTSEQGST